MKKYKKIKKDSPFGGDTNEKRFGIICVYHQRHESLVSYQKGRGNG